jgi:hypothetical protein
MKIIKSQKATILNLSSSLRIQVWAKKNLPIENSQLALQLILIISYNTMIKKPLTLKLLFHSVDFSEAGVRKQLRKLLIEDWCCLVEDLKDKRLKLVVAQPKMLYALSEYSELLTSAYKQSSKRTIQHIGT